MWDNLKDIGDKDRKSIICWKDIQGQTKDNKEEEETQNIIEEKFLSQRKIRI